MAGFAVVAMAGLPARLGDVPYRVNVQPYSFQDKVKTMIKVHILTTSSHCNGEAYLPIGQEINAQGKPYTRHVSCPTCEGSGLAPKWVSLNEFAQLLNQVLCPHIHTSLEGGFHFSAGDVWDDLTEVCDDCGADLDQKDLP